MLANCPTSIVVHGLALNITVQSFDEHMDFGLMADAAALPDVKTLAMAVDTALDELRGLPHSLPATPAAPAPSAVAAQPHIAGPAGAKVSRKRPASRVNATRKGV